MWHKRILFSLLLLSVMSDAATISRVTNFVDGEVLYSADLNAEFNNIISSGVNNINNDNIVAGAAIAPSKISASIDGSGIERDGTTGALSAKPDGVGIEVASDTIRLKDLGIASAKYGAASIIAGKLAADSVATTNIIDSNVTANKLATDAVTSGKIQNGAVIAGKLGTDAVVTANIADAQVTRAKLAALNYAVSSSCGAFTTTSGSFVDVTNLSVTITTTGRPVFVGLQSAGSGAAGYITQNTAATGVKFAFLLNGNFISGFQNGSYGGAVPPAIPVGSLWTIDTTAPAGSNTYKAQLAVTASGTAILSDAVLFAYEL